MPSSARRNTATNVEGGSIPANDASPVRTDLPEADPDHSATWRKQIVRTPDGSVKISFGSKPSGPLRRDGVMRRRPAPIRVDDRKRAYVALMIAGIVMCALTLRALHSIDLHRTGERR